MGARWWPNTRLSEACQKQSRKGAATKLPQVVQDPPDLLLQHFIPPPLPVLSHAGGLMSDATKLAPELQAAAMRDISAEGLPSAIERQAAAGKGAGGLSYRGLRGRGLG